MEEIDRAIRDLRNYIFGLRPGILADRHLDQALQTLGEEFQIQSNVVTIVDVVPSAAAEMASKATEIVQLTREALSNVGRHAHADDVPRIAAFRRRPHGRRVGDRRRRLGIRSRRPTDGHGPGEPREPSPGPGRHLDDPEHRGSEGTTVRAFVPL